VPVGEIVFVEKHVARQVGQDFASLLIHAKKAWHAVEPLGCQVIEKRMLNARVLPDSTSNGIADTHDIVHMPASKFDLFRHPTLN
jgi:hypothetical protein